MPDQSLFAEEHLLAADPQRKRALLRVADVTVGLPQVERVPERRRRRANVLRRDASVLGLHEHG